MPTQGGLLLSEVLREREAQIKVKAEKEKRSKELGKQYQLIEEEVRRQLCCIALWCLYIRTYLSFAHWKRGVPYYLVHCGTQHLYIHIYIYCIVSSFIVCVYMCVCVRRRDARGSSRTWRLQRRELEHRRKSQCSS